jgi:hypothetical protein
MTHDHHAHHADHHDADAEYLPVEGSSYEHTDADVRTTVRFGVWLVAIAVATHVLLGGVFAGLIAWSNETGEPRYPLAAGRPAPKPPEPTLQQYPDRDMTVFRARDAGELGSYGYVDRENGRVHIPIDEAIRQTLERGLPARPEADAGAAGTPGMLATDSSAGRLLERRRQ